MDNIWMQKKKIQKRKAKMKVWTVNKLNQKINNKKIK